MTMPESDTKVPIAEEEKPNEPIYTTTIEDYVKRAIQIPLGIIIVSMTKQEQDKMIRVLRKNKPIVEKVIFEAFKQEIKDRAEETTKVGETDNEQEIEAKP